MTTLEGDEDFLCINQNVNIFDIISCKEEQASQIIAWLLNPREAHGFGNRFFEAMLNAASSNSQLSGYKYIERQAETKRKQKQKLLDAYNDVIVQTEYCIDKQCKDKEGRVDILLCLEDKDAKALFVIENKYGSQEHGKQTKKYFNHFSKAKEYHNYTVFYIYLDVKKYFEMDTFELSDNEEHWYFLGYDWIIDFLKKNAANECVRKIIQDIIIEFDGDHEYEKYFKPFYTQTKTLFSKYKEDLSHYKNPYPYLPSSPKKSNKQFAIYNDFYGSLAQYSQWDTLIEELEKKGYVADVPSDNYIDITLEKIRDKYKELNKNTKTKKWWPFYVNINHLKPKDEENGKAYLEIKLLCTNEYIKTNNKPKIKKDLARLFGNKKAKYQRYITQNITNIKPYKSGENISIFYLHKEIIEDFDFSENKLDELCTIVNNNFTKDLEEMYKIFFPKKDISK